MTGRTHASRIGNLSRSGEGPGRCPGIGRRVDQGYSDDWPDLSQSRNGVNSFHAFSHVLERQAQTITLDTCEAKLWLPGRK
jgi:hypothetical protein